MHIGTFRITKLKSPFSTLVKQWISITLKMGSIKDGFNLFKILSIISEDKQMGVLDICRNIININNKYYYSEGPNILPCGTPEITGNEGEITPSSLIKWALLVKYDMNQSNKFPEIPSNSIFTRSSE